MNIRLVNILGGLLSILGWSLLMLMMNPTTATPKERPWLDSRITVEYSSLWTEWKQRFNRTYASADEELLRRVRWEKNILQIEQHNRQFDLGRHSYNMGLNQFSDMNFQEFKRLYLVGETTVSEMTTTLNSSQIISSYLEPLNSGQLPSAVDWRKLGYVTPVKNQGQCGSCWAFSTTGSLEGQTYRKTKKLPRLSEQQLVDCSSINLGCHGGIPTLAYMYIKRAGGIASEVEYPYKAKKDKCKYNPKMAVAHCSGFKLVLPIEHHLAIATANEGPISVLIVATENLMHYKSGIFHDPSCSWKLLNHAVLVVGYESKPEAYWIVKNSWGPSWGESGYVRMARNENICGIADFAVFPLV